MPDIHGNRTKASYSDPARHGEHDPYANQGPARERLPCSYCGRMMENEALVGIPSPGTKGKLACPTCAAELATSKEAK